MDNLQRLNTLSNQMYLEPAEDSHCPQKARKRDGDIAVSKAVLPNGKRIRLLKTLLSSACERNCYYCPFRSGRDFRRATFKPDEFAYLASQLYHTGVVEGIFLSSGIVSGGIATQDRLIAAADLLRNKFSYRGYLHLKIMPGAECDQVEQTMLLANRVSINLEAPNPERLCSLAPGKRFNEELLDPLRWINKIRKEKHAARGWKGKWPSSVTQFVVGGSGESDIELLEATENLYREASVSRSYYSPFRPVQGTPLENHPPTPLRREYRLYQASFLIRDYGFTSQDLSFLDDGNLPLDVDPKLVWARKNLQSKPVEINRADRRLLLRVPGIGPKAAEAILKIRRQRLIKDLHFLSKIGVNSSRVAPFVLVGGKKPSRQLGLFVS
ncbi:MAG: radical SAM protein [Anaerolineales bacterium]|jgi:predicted DNA-binding helix-hairpin-helix protein